MGVRYSPHLQENVYKDTQLCGCMEVCIFCTIIAGKIPCFKVYEDECVLAFLDIKPHAMGHTVVIPKMHGEVIFDLPEREQGALMLAVSKVMQILEKKLHCGGFNVGWNHHAIAGQVVPHLHVHILPRYSGDNGWSIHSIIHNAGPKSVEEISKLFK